MIVLNSVFCAYGGSNSPPIDLPFTVVNITGCFATYAESHRLLRVIDSMRPGAEQGQSEYSLHTQMCPHLCNRYIYESGNFFRITGPEESIMGIFSGLKEAHYKPTLIQALKILNNKKRQDGKKILIYAPCAGGARFLSMLSDIQDNAEYKDLIDGVILENVPIDFAMAVYDMPFAPFRYIPLIGRSLARFFSCLIFGRGEQLSARLQRLTRYAIPTLIIHSKKDWVVRDSQSCSLVNILSSKSGANLTFRHLEGGGHSKLLSSVSPLYSQTLLYIKNFLQVNDFI